MTKFHIGRHISISHGFLGIPSMVHHLGYNFFQIFMKSPESLTLKMRNKEDLAEFALELEKYHLEMVIHGSYAINLAQPVKSKKFVSSVRSLVQDLESAAIIGNRCKGVIIHMGKNVPENKISYERAVDNYIGGLALALKDSPPPTVIILETGAGQGSQITNKIGDLAELYWRMNPEQRSRIKFCIDICHIWAVGYDISSAQGVRKFFDEFSKKIGLDKIACIHFNDSKTPLGSKVDRHADLGYGLIGTEGLKAVAKFAFKHKISLVAETPLSAINPKTNQDIDFEDELQRIKGWIGAKTI